MNTETSDTLDTMNNASTLHSPSTMHSPSSMNGPGTGVDSNVVHRVAQKAHETVDRLEQTVSTGSERVMSLQEEYGAYAREQIRAHPLGTVLGALAVGWLLGKVMR